MLLIFSSSQIYFIYECVKFNTLTSDVIINIFSLTPFFKGISTFISRSVLFLFAPFDIDDFVSLLGGNLRGGPRALGYHTYHQKHLLSSHLSQAPSSESLYSAAGHCDSDAWMLPLRALACPPSIRVIRDSKHRAAGPREVMTPSQADGVHRGMSESSRALACTASLRHPPVEPMSQRWRQRCARSCAPRAESGYPSRSSWPAESISKTHSTQHGPASRMPAGPRRLGGTPQGGALENRSRILLHTACLQYACDLHRQPTPLPGAARGPACHAAAIRRKGSAMTIC